MAVTPGTPDYYRLPLAARKKQFDQARWITAAGGSQDAVPLESYFTPQEAAWIGEVSKQHLQGWASEVQKKFPAQAPYLNNPEIAEILHQAVAHKWTPQILQSHLEASTWWKSHSPNQRQWFILNNTDPAAAHQSVSQQMEEVLHTSRGMGIKLKPSQATWLAIQTLDQGWSDQHLLDQILHMGKDQDISGGSMHVTKNQLLSIARDYLQPVSNDTLNKWTRMIAGGTSTIDSWRETMMRYAQSQFGYDQNIQHALQHGQTMKDYAEPFVQLAAQTLGLNPNDVDIEQRQWQAPLKYMDPDSGKMRAMTLNEWEREIKLNKGYGYDSSKNGIDEASTLVSGIRDRFGIS